MKFLKINNKIILKDLYYLHVLIIQDFKYLSHFSDLDMTKKVRFMAFVLGKNQGIKRKEKELKKNK